jgi:two-component system response regulator RegX3
MARVLFVEDEPALRRSVSYALRREGFAVETVANGEKALEATEDTCDVMILDLMLPGVSGTDVLRTLRETSALPIIVLTSKDTEVDRVLGLELGADDYMTKPFSMMELVSRVRAILRRRELDRVGAGSVREIGGIRIDLRSHEVAVDDRSVYLTPSQFKLLALFAEIPGRVVTRREMMQHLWASNHVGDEHVCDVHVSNLRHKIERDPTRPRRIVTVRGAGYKLVAA